MNGASHEEQRVLLGVDDQMAGLSLRRQVRGILTPEQLGQLDDLRGEHEVRIIIGGVGSSWSTGRSGC